MAQLSIFRFRPTGEPLALKFECEKDNPQDNRIFLDIVQSAQNKRLRVGVGVQRIYLFDDDCEDPVFEQECSDTEAQHVHACISKCDSHDYRIRAVPESGVLYLMLTEVRISSITADQGKPIEVIVDQKALVHFDDAPANGVNYPLVTVEAGKGTHLWCVLRSAIDTQVPMKNMMINCSGIVVTLWFNFFGERLLVSAVSNKWIVDKLSEILRNAHGGSGCYVYVLTNTENDHLALAFANVEIPKGILELRNFEVLGIYTI